MSEWQQGLLSGIFAIIIVFTIDTLASWPYVIQILIAVTMGVFAAMVCNKVVHQRRKYQKNWNREAFTIYELEVQETE